MRGRHIDRDLILRAAADGALMLYVRTAVPWGKGGPTGQKPTPYDDDEDDEDDEDGEHYKARTPVIASTATPDRYGDIVVQSGWRLDNFKNNPVIMPFHDYSSPPVGRGENVRLVSLGPDSKAVDDDGGPAGVADALAMDIVWDTGLELGATLARQYREGFMRGVSVGFRPIDFSARSTLDDDDPQKSDMGFLIKSAELLELSAAPVPVQQEALAIKALGMGYQIAAAPTPGDTDAGVLRALRKALRHDTETQRAIRQLFRAFELAGPAEKRNTTYNDAADWLAS